MRYSRFGRLLTAAVIVGLAASPGLAWADTTISINPGNVPTTAAGYQNQECGGVPGGPLAGQDVWVFNLPGNQADSGDFVTITAQFTTPGGDVTRTIPTDGGAIFTAGHSKAYIALPAGWTLTGATAVITGTADKFVLTHTCPTDGPNNPGSSATPTPPPGTPGTPGNPGNPGTPGLPVTGTAVTAVALAGAVITGIGAVLLVVMNRRRQVRVAKTVRTGMNPFG